mgnify:CR=1 FL=1
MNRLCAWCGRNLDEDGPAAGNGAGPDSGPVTPGICPECRDRLTTGTGIPITEFIASLDEPVVLMDADHTVGMINRAARELFSEDVETVIGERAGRVFQCENAHMPGGCGLTIHCSGCTIRHAVAHTHLTGEPRLNVPATLRVVDDPRISDIELVISTARVGNRVLLKIDHYAD